MHLVAFFLVYEMADMLLIYLSNSSYAWLDPGRANIVAPVARFKTANKLAEPSALVVSIDQFEELFGRHVDLSLCSFFGPKIVYLLRSFECKTLSVLIFYLKILSHVIVGQLSLSYRSFPHSPNSRASLSG